MSNVGNGWCFVARRLVAFSLVLAGQVGWVPDAMATDVTPLSVPEATVVCQGSSGGAPGSTVTTPGRWWNPERDGTGWDLIYLDDNRHMAAVWYTYDNSGAPVWLLAPGGPFSNGMWQSQLEKYSFNQATNTATGQVVGSVALTQIPGNASRAVVTWRWYEVSGTTSYTECINEFGLDATQVNSTNSVSAGIFGGWVPDNTARWSAFLNMQMVGSAGNIKYVEVATLTTYNDSGEPRWIQSVSGLLPTQPPLNQTLSYGLDYFSAGGPPTQTEFGFSGNGLAVGTWVRNFHDSQTATASVDVDHTAPNGAMHIDTQNVTIRKITGANLIKANPVGDCVASVGANTCAVTVNWASANVFAGGASVFRRSPNPELNRVLLETSAAGELQDLLPVGTSASYELRASENPTSALLSESNTITSIANTALGVQVVLAPGQTLNAPADTLLNVTTSGTVAKVEVFGDGQLLATHAKNTSSAYPTLWTALSAGQHTAYAIATAANGATAQSSTLTFTINQTAVAESVTPDATTDGVGAIPGTFRVDESGAATYSIDLALPKGTAGVAPEVSLNYSSNAGQGLMGRGWALGGMSSVSRCRRTVEAGDFVGSTQDTKPVNLSATDEFCMDGVRLIKATGTNLGCPAYSGFVSEQYRHEIDQFSRICAYRRTSSANEKDVRFFVASDRDGKSRWYGDRRTSGDTTAAGAIEVQTQSGSRIVSWSLNRILDPVGNYIDYRYLLGAPTSGLLAGTKELTLDRIEYTGNVSMNVTPVTNVIFDYEEAEVSPGALGRGVSYVAGYALVSSKRLKSVRIEDNGAYIRRYALGYSQVSSMNAWLLKDIRECYSAATTSCREPTVFDYGPESTPKLVKQTATASWDTGSSSKYEGYKIADVNGDGLNDIVTMKDGVGNEGCATDQITVVLGQVSNGSFGYSDTFNVADVITCPFAEIGVERVEDGKLPSGAWFLHDWNQDGKAELYVHISRMGWYVYDEYNETTAVGSDGETYPAIKFTTLKRLPSLPISAEEYELPRLADINGDGLLDFVSFDGSTAAGGVIKVNLASRSLINEYNVAHPSSIGGGKKSNPIVELPPEDAEPRWLGARTVSLADVPTSCNVSNACRLTGFFQNGNYQQATDINGDGRADLILEYRSNASGVPGVTEGPAWANSGASDDNSPTPNQPQEEKKYLGIFAVESIPEGGSTNIGARLYGGAFWDVATLAGTLYFDDLNGDGLSDIFRVHPLGGSSKFQVNTGNGFGAASYAHCNSDLISNENYAAMYLQFSDVSADGIPDLIYPRFEGGMVKYKARMGLGSAGMAKECVTNGNVSRPLFGEEVGLDLDYSAGELSDVNSNPVIFGDQDSDGALDALLINIRDNQSNNVSIWRRSTSVGSGGVAPIMHPLLGLLSVQNSLGAFTSVQYAALSNPVVHRLAAGTFGTEVQGYGFGSPVFDAPFPRFVVSHVASNSPTKDSVIAQAHISYRYVGARLQAGGRGSLGFSEIWTYDTNHVGTEATANGTGLTITRFRQDFPFIGMPSATERYRIPPAGGSAVPCSAGRLDCHGQLRAAWVLPVNAQRISAATNSYAISFFDAPSSSSNYVSFAAARAQRGANLSGLAVRTSTVLESTYDPFNTSITQPVSSVLTANREFDAFGNVLELDVASYVGSTALPPYQTTHTVSTYSNSTSPMWKLGRLDRSTVTHDRDDATPITRVAEFEYDSNNGLLRAEKVMQGTSVSSQKRYVYDSFGNIRRAAVCSGDIASNTCETANPVMQPSSASSVHRVTITEYDSRGRYETTVKGFFNGASSPVVETEVLARDRFGNPTHVRNAAGLDQRFVSGNFGQPYYSWTESVPNAVLGAANQGIASRVTRTYCGTAAICPESAVFRETVTATGAPRQWIYYNALAEEVARVAESFVTGSSRSLSMVCTERDLRRRTVEVTEPISVGTVTATGVPGTSNGIGTACRNTPYRSVTRFDMLDRVTATIAPDGGVTTVAYRGLETLTTLPLTVATPIYRQRWQRKNALGEVVESRDPDPSGDAVDPADWTQGNGLTTVFIYDATGNLVSVTRGGVQTTTMNYDSLGRKIRQVDPDAGEWNYRYNALGEQILQYDGGFVAEPTSVSTAGRTLIEQLYDARGRVYKRVSRSPGQAGAETVSFTFDTGVGANPGLLMSEWVSGSYETTSGLPTHDLRRNYVYDALGRQMGVDTLVGSFTYSERVHRDALGRARKSQDAAGGWLLSEYNALGMAVAVCDSTAGATATTCPLGAGSWQRINTVDARGQVMNESRGNGVTVGRSYDPFTGRLTSLNNNANGQIVSADTYAWDALGNLERRTRQGLSRSSYTERFQYDGMNRLTEGRMDIDGGKTDVLTLSLSYDGVGNICNRIGNGSTLGGFSASANFSYGTGACTPQTHSGGAQIGLPGQHGSVPAHNRLAELRESATSVRTFTYDAHGNQTETRTGASLLLSTAYSATQQAYRIANSQGRTERFWYGSGGEKYRRMVSVGGSTETTLYLGAVEVVEKAGVRTFKRNIGGIAVQTLSQGNVVRSEILLHDHLGSVVSVYDNGNAAPAQDGQMDYGPFGTRRLVNDPVQYGPGVMVSATDKGFTGHAMLDQLGVIHMNGRIYDPLQMRFMQADPFVQDPLSAQSYNRYLYLWNNPLNGTDPTGYLGIKERQWLGTVVAIVGSVFVPQFSHVWAKLAYVAAVGAVSGGITTGSWNGAAKGAFTSVLTAGVGGAGMGPVQQVMANAFFGGAVSVMQGGKFGHGFVSAGLGTLAGSAINARVSSPGGQIVAHALVGGSISAVTGGKFANGAATAAFRAALVVGRDGPSTPSDRAGVNRRPGWSVSGVKRLLIKSEAGTEFLSELQRRNVNVVRFETATDRIYREDGTIQEIDRSGDLAGNYDRKNTVYINAALDLRQAVRTLYHEYQHFLGDSDEASVYAKEEMFADALGFPANPNFRNSGGEVSIDAIRSQLEGSMRNFYLPQRREPRVYGGTTNVRF